MQEQTVKGKRVTVLGAARSGLAVTKFLVRAGARVLLSDSGPIDPVTLTWCKKHGVIVEANGHTKATLSADFLVVSPGVPSAATPVQEALTLGLPVYSELEIASRYAKGQIIAVTGTNGKTTTTSLIGHMMKTADRQVVVAGNNGSPLSDHLKELRRDTVVVLEVSSFQLDHAETFCPKVSVVLNITPDHLDRYGGSFEHYAESKLRIYENQSTGDVVVYNYDDTLVRERVEHFVTTSDVRGLPFSRQVHLSNGASAVKGLIRLQERTLLRTDELGIPGPHNVGNSLAAALAGQAAGLSDEVLRESLRGFTGVDHRLEIVRRVEGVTYVNDSKATNVNAVWYALQSFKAPIILLVGGRDKGNDYEILKPLITSKVPILIAFGESAPTVMKELGPCSNNAMEVNTLDEATQVARDCAQAGDVVLLSPACSSFDLFSNYEERGMRFKSIVEGF
ncbi:MAG: UDP-N-acetylmuramoyl-L-alanine--D-glutamate ligase [Bacteroidetes bacterium]|nr:UDP-N-acetylmuramoyl-L-alanine--D-glutamate ligase [Bacteroidota bacterium]MDE2672074.1 UDP-N-acetylmuramoyl-L-alanine--D-glutamate ligase [Bacteroidota bacterium]